MSPIDPAVRRARPDEVDLVMPAAAAMFTEEIGYPPYWGSGTAYRQGIAGLIARGHTFVRVEDGEVVFKADVGSVGLGVAQIQGVWVAPGLARAGARRAGDGGGGRDGDRPTIAPVATLYVNDFNAPARATYRGVGFTEVGQLRHRAAVAHAGVVPPDPWPDPAGGSGWIARVAELTRDLKAPGRPLPVSGVLHLVRPQVFEPIVPRPCRRGAGFVLVSGVAEIACAAGLLHPRTRRSAGWASAALLVAVLPANVQMTADARRRADRTGHRAPFLATALARLPLQVPLVRTALRATRPAKHGVSRRAADRYPRGVRGAPARTRRRSTRGAAHVDPVPANPARGPGRR